MFVLKFDESIACPDLWNVATAVLRRRVIVLNTCFIKQMLKNIKDVPLLLKKLEK